MKKSIITLLFFSLIWFSHNVVAQRLMEKLNRGLVAVHTTTNQVFLSWRVLGSDPANIAFNIYRNGVKINSEAITGATNFTDNSTSGTIYTVKTVIEGVETGEQMSSNVFSNNYFDIIMDVPAVMTMPDGSTCTYSPNDCSVGDVDGDGEFEIIVKWDPSNSKDNSQSGYTGDVFIDCYKLNSTKLWRIDLGKNIRAGAHYSQIQVADYDGDGKAEVACKTAPGTIDGLGNFLSKGPAASDNDATDYRNTSGYILTGPEYLTVFSGITGAELATALYNPGRGTVSTWGDSYGNRVDRFLAGTAYLDGVQPSIIMCRGYYTRATIAAWNYRNGTLTNIWLYDSGTTSGVGLYGQGNHNMSIGDVDDDGKDEIIWGAGAVDDNGKLMYRTGLGHGDAMHLSDLDPDKKGLEVWEVHEETGALFGEELHEAKTGMIYWGTFTGTDNGRGLAANVIPGNRGFEMWSASGTGTLSKTGTLLQTNKPSMNFRIYWDGDTEDELLDGTSITKFNTGTLLSAENCSSNNSTKSNPCLSADIFGDWREEVLFRTADNKAIRVYTTTIPTSFKTYTLMHDAVYRAGIAWQNTAYNQPPHLGFYMGDDMDTPPASPCYSGEKRWKSGTTWDISTSACWTDSLNQTASFKNGDGALFDLTSGANSNISIIGDVNPKSLKINSPYNVTISGAGSLNGKMELRKLGAGVLKFNNINNYTGITTVWDGEFYNNGILANSQVYIKSFVKLGGSGTFGNNVNLGNLSTLMPGNVTGECTTLKFSKDLITSGAVTIEYDISLTNSIVSSQDSIFISGNLNLSNSTIFNLNVINGSLPAGVYTLLKCSGTITGDLNKIKINGIPTYLSYNLLNENGIIKLKLNPPAYLTWKGTTDNKWDNGKTSNWSLLSEMRTFSSNDSILFNDETTINSINIAESVIPASIVVETASSYSFTGAGSIEGNGGITKKGNGKLTLSTTNKYLGKTVIKEGTLEILSLANGGVNSPIGASSNLASNLVLDGGKLNYLGSTASIDRGLTLGVGGGNLYIANSSASLSTSGKFTGPGRLIKDGPGRLSMSIANNYTGGTTLKGGSIALTSDAANISGLGTSDTISFMGGNLIMFDSNTTDNTSNWNLKIPAGYSGTLYTDGKSLISGTITGAGNFYYYTNYTGNILASDVSQFSGTLNVTTDADGGFFSLYSSKGYERSKINLNNLVTMIYRGTSNIIIPVGDLTGTVNSILGAGGTGLCNVTWEIGARNVNSTFNGKITNAQYSGTGATAAINKVGTGTWTLTNDNTFSGGTNILKGTLMANNVSGSALGTGYVAVNSDATLSGSGIIAGKTYVYYDGSIEPGNGIGTLTINNDVEFQEGSFLTIEVDKSKAKNDTLKSNATITMNGTLVINPSESTVFTQGDSFKIINGVIKNLPVGISPAQPGEGLEWDLSDFLTLGVLKVKSTTEVKNIGFESKVYPNPVHDFLKISVKDFLYKVDVEIYNSLGEKLLMETHDDNEFIIRVAELPEGLYLLRMKSGDKIYSKVLIKQ